MRRKACISTSFQVAGPQLLLVPISVRESSLGMPPLRNNALEGEPPQGVYANASSIEKLAANRQTRSIALAAITIAEQIGSRD
jgi:hypothetical protein